MNEQMILYIFSSVMVLVTVCLIPFALKSKNRKFTLAALLIPLAANIACYFIFDKQVAFFYLAVIGAISLLLIRKK